MSLQKRGDPIDFDNWTLHAHAEDFSESIDLRRQHPAKLEELVAAFDEAAWANMVYPLDNRTPIQKFNELPPHQRPARSSRRRFSCQESPPVRAHARAKSYRNSGSTRFKCLPIRCLRSSDTERQFAVCFYLLIFNSGNTVAPIRIRELRRTADYRSLLCSGNSRVTSLF